jgi:hypothetical protein
LGWSPDSTQIIAYIPANPNSSESSPSTFLLDATSFNQPQNLRDVSAQLSLIFSQWEEQIARKLNEQLLILPLEMQKIATASATNVYFSPDEEKLLYTATSQADIPENLIPPLVATSTQLETRHIEPRNTYVYDIQEDKNFLITSTDELAKELEPSLNKVPIIDQIVPRNLISLESSPSAHTRLQTGNTEETLKALSAQYSPISIQNIQWYPNSKHLILVYEDKISMVDYDGTNIAVVYSGKFENRFVFPWPDGSKLLILTNLNPESELPPNLYAVNLK